MGSLRTKLREAPNDISFKNSVRPNWAVKRTPTRAMPSAFSWPLLVPCAPSVLRRRLPGALGVMFDEATLRKLAEWEPIAPCSEATALKAAQVFVSHIDPDVGVKAFVREGSYENFVSAYVYLPANVARTISERGTRADHKSLVLYFSHLVPFVALGTGSWGETKDETGQNTSWGYSGLDTLDLISEEQLPDGPLKMQLVGAVKASGYEVASPVALNTPAPNWFEPRQRSEGVPPWNRMFHLLFQFCD